MKHQRCRVYTRRLRREHRVRLEALLHQAQFVMPDWLRNLTFAAGRSRGLTAEVDLSRVEYRQGFVYLHPAFWRLPELEQLDALIHEIWHLHLEPFYRKLLVGRRDVFAEEELVQDLTHTVLDVLELRPPRTRRPKFRMHRG